MNINFIKQINDYVIEATMEASDDEVLSTIGHANYPTWEDIHSVQDLILTAIKNKRQQRLEKNRVIYLDAKEDLGHLHKLANTTKTVTEMLSDIVAAMQDKDSVPKGLLVAFRNQGQNGDEDDIKELWQTLVELGLIEISDDEQ